MLGLILSRAAQVTIDGAIPQIATNGRSESRAAWPARSHEAVDIGQVCRLPAPPLVRDPPAPRAAVPSLQTARRSAFKDASAHELTEDWILTNLFPP
jgi:hypothetical protein